MIRSLMLCLTLCLGGPLAMAQGPGGGNPPGVNDPEPGGGSSSSSSTDNLQGVPSASSQVRLRFGQVDAVTGDLSLSAPLGPRLPGRIPLGFTWNYELAGGRAQYGSAIYPISWPSPEMPNPQITMWFNGSQLRFLKAATPTLGIPTAATVSEWLRKRRAPETLLSRFASGAKVYCSADGARFLIVSGAAPTAMAVVDGVNAIWTADTLADPRITTVTNLWGDEVAIKEESFSSGANYPSNVLCKYVPKTTTIWNTRVSGQTITLAITSEGTYYCPGEFRVSNSMGYPTATVSGILRVEQRNYYQPNPGASTFTHVFLPYADYHFLPLRITLTASDGSSQASVFDWGTGTTSVSPSYAPCGTYVQGQLVVTYPIDYLSSITHHDGLVESFEFTTTAALAGNSFDKITGKWKGWGPTAPDNNGTPALANPSQGISKITFRGAEVDQTVWIARTLPLSLFNTSTGTRSWPQPKHETFILYFPTSQPTSGTPYRGVRLTHPDGGSWGTTTDAQAYLFATSAIVKAESIYGTGIPSMATSQPYTYIPPTAYTVYDTTSYENWELRSWGNPLGSLNLPVNAQPTRIARRPVGLPEEVKLLGEWDTYGPTRTDSETWLSGAAGPAPTGNNVAAWGAMVVGASSAPIHRMSKITRHWDNALGALFTDTERSTLDGSSLPALRGVSSVDFGTTTSIRDSLGRVTSVIGATGAFTATETRSYEPGLPLVNDITKSLTDGATTYLANPDNGAVQAGSRATYDGTPFRWPLTQTDKVDGRLATFVTRDSLGRPTQTQAPDGTLVDTSYDVWGRVASTVRRSRSNASGTVDAVTTTYEYDTANRIRTETVRTGSKTLVTRTRVDAFGRVVRVDLPGNRYQETFYDGFGQKAWQTPVMVAGQTGYGIHRWSYDAQGRLTESRDPQGRLLTRTLQQPAWGTIVRDGKTLTGVIHTVQDDRGYPRSTVTDLLGQKAAVVDQKDQVSQYFYDKHGRLKRTEQGTQQRHYSYNDLGWLLSRTEPEEGTTTYSRFNLMGAPTRTRLSGRNGGSQADTELTLDAHLRPSRIRATWAADPSAAVDRAITYDSTFYVPLTLTETQPKGTLTETYVPDAAGRLISKTVSDGTQSFTVERTLDALGNPTSLTYPAGGGRAPQLLTIAYDDALRPLELSLDGTRKARMAYDQVEGTAVRDALTLGPEGSAVKTTSKVDRGELTQVIHAYAGGSDAFDLTWTAGGLMTRRGSDTFFYDELQRLTEASIVGAPGTPQAGKVLTQKFAYDRYGNRTWNWAGITSGTVADSAPEVKNWSAPYDGTNSLPASLTALAADGSTATGSLSTGALYDDLGRLTRVYAIPGASSSQMAWAYDALGRVISENGTTFLLDAEGLRFKRMKADGSVQYTVYGFGREPLSVFEQNGTQTEMAEYVLVSGSNNQVARNLCTNPSMNQGVEGWSAYARRVDAGGLDPALAGQGAIELYDRDGYWGPMMSVKPGDTFQFELEGWADRSSRPPTGTLGIGLVVSNTASTSYDGTWNWFRCDSSLGENVTGKQVLRGTLILPAGMTQKWARLWIQIDAPWGQTGSWYIRKVKMGRVFQSPSGQTQGNFCTNPSMDQGTEGWSGYVRRVDAGGLDSALSGQGAIELFDRDGYWGPQMSVQSGDVFEFELEGWADRSGRPPTGTLGIGLVVSNTTSTSYDGTWNWFRCNASLGENVTGKQVLRGTLILPAGMTQKWARLWVQIDAPWGQSGSWYMRRISMSRSTVSGGTPISAYGVSWQRSMVYGFGGLVSEERPEGTYFVQGDQVGSPNIITNGAGAVVGRSKNLPFGERFGSAGYRSNRRYTNHEETEDYAIYMQARTYLPAYGKFAQVDPAYDQTKDDPESWNLYNYVTNNPVTHTDPDGREKFGGIDVLSSTHTDSSGKVIAVYDDGDLGVYKHNNIAPGTYDGRYLDKNGKDVQMMGVTRYWNSFLTPDGKIAPGTCINFDTSIDKEIVRLHEYAISHYGPNELANASKNGQPMDFKSKFPHTMIGYKLFGKYVTVREAGNFLFGWNASKIVGNWGATMRLAGALQQLGPSGYSKLTKMDKFDIAIGNKSYGPPPYYGEIEYSGRMISEGWHSSANSPYGGWEK